MEELLNLKIEKPEYLRIKPVPNDNTLKNDNVLLMVVIKTEKD